MLCEPVASRRRRGWPDLQVLHGGVTVYIELKHPNGRGRLSELQRHVLGEIEAHGGKTYVINSLAEAQQIAGVLADTAAGVGDNQAV